MVQAQSHPEYLKFPNRCVCCNRLDERNYEMAVSSTDESERENYLIFEVELPYCLECYQHLSKRPVWPRILAIFLALSLIGLAVHILTIACLVLFVVYLFWEWKQNLKYRNAACTALNRHVTFIDPTSSNMSTVLFTNPQIELAFRELNRNYLV
jgi:hypothetical protein